MNRLINGIDGEVLSRFKRSLTAQDMAGQVNYGVVTSWRGGMRSESDCLPVSIGGKKSPSPAITISSDEPVMLGGEGLAPNPQELMLAAFNACLTAAYVTAATTEGVRLDKLQITTTGQLDLRGFFGTDEDVEPGNESISYLISVKGSGSIQQFERLHRKVIASSPNRWVIAQHMLIEGDQVVETTE